MRPAVRTHRSSGPRGPSLPSATPLLPACCLLLATAAASIHAESTDDAQVGSPTVLATESEESSSSDWLPLYIAAPIVGVALITAVIAYCCVRRRRQRRKEAGLVATKAQPGVPKGLWPAAPQSQYAVQQPPPQPFYAVPYRQQPMPQPLQQPMPMQAPPVPPRNASQPLPLVDQPPAHRTIIPPLERQYQGPLAPVVSLPPPGVVAAPVGAGPQHLQPANGRMNLPVSAPMAGQGGAAVRAPNAGGNAHFARGVNSSQLQHFNYQLPPAQPVGMNVNGVNHPPNVPARPAAVATPLPPAVPPVLNPGLYSYNVEDSQQGVPLETDGSPLPAAGQPYIYRYDDDEPVENPAIVVTAPPIVPPVPVPVLEPVALPAPSAPPAPIVASSSSSSSYLAPRQLPAPAVSSGVLTTRGVDRVLKSFDIPPEDVVMGPIVGRGAFGTVYRAEYRGVDAAVKVIDLSLTGDLQTAFERELSVMCSVHNNRLIQIYGAHRDPKSPWIVMEWMERGSLSDVLHGSSNPQLGRSASPASLSPQRRLTMAIQIIEGLTYMHSCKPPMLHTDIKAQNVMVDASFNAKLGDFGFATILAGTGTISMQSLRSTLHNTLRPSGPPSVGATLAYLAPEALGEEIIPPDTYLDLYAVGVVLWELFSGSVPWAGYSFTQIITAVGVCRKTLPMLPQIPKPVQPILQALFAERKQRPPAKTVLRMLRDINPDSLNPPKERNIAAIKSIESTYV